MKLERFDFKNLHDKSNLVLAQPAAIVKVFVPSGTQKVDAPPPPAPPVYKEEDLKKAEHNGYKKGFHEGTQEGRKQVESEQAEVDRRLVEMLEQFVQSVSPLFDHYKKMVVQVQQDVPKAALAIARKVASAALDRNAETVVSDIATRCCETMINEPELSITVHESMGDTLERKLKEMATRLPAATHIVIMRDPAMPAADCRIEWKHGALERVTAQLWQQVEQAVGDMSVIAGRETAEELKALEAPPPSTNTDEPSSSKKE